MCFQILGFDIMLDHKCKPYLLEVNHSPSFSTDSPLDEKVKGDLIRDTIRMLGLSKQRKAMYKRNIQSQMEHRIKSGKFLRLPADLREKWRLEFDAIRNAHELENLGSFEQLYPC
jgi:tubulin polyglutamylase TTLL6/13